MGSDKQPARNCTCLTINKATDAILYRVLNEASEISSASILQDAKTDEDLNDKKEVRLTYKNLFEFEIITWDVVTDIFDVIMFYVLLFVTVL